VEASALQAPAALSHRRVLVGLPLRLRSDDQLVALFRAGHNAAFDVIHDRYRARLFAYTRQMLPSSRQDAEDALQDVFVRAYGGLRASNRDLALRAWLYRVAHNRCIDELRRPPLPSPELLELTRPPACDPIVIAEQRDTLRQLLEDVRRLPEQQRSALLMRELSDMSYAELSGALDVSVPAVKSLLVRARVGLAKAAEARDVACSSIREELSIAHDRGVRSSGTARRHLHDCKGCREFRREMRSVTKQLSALAPTLGPAAVIAKLIGIGGKAGGTAATGSAASGGAAGGTAAGGGAVVAGGAAGGATGAGGVFATGGMLAGGASHMATLLAAAVITAGGAVELQQTITQPAQHHRAVHHVLATNRPVRATPPTAVRTSTGGVSVVASTNRPVSSGGGTTIAKAAKTSPSASAASAGSRTPGTSQRDVATHQAALPDMTPPATAYDTPTTTAPTTPPTTTAPTTTAAPGNPLLNLLGGDPSSTSGTGSTGTTGSGSTGTPGSTGATGSTNTGSTASTGSTSGTSSTTGTGSTSGTGSTTGTGSTGSTGTSSDTDSGTGSSSSPSS
jgi:RNA polymerase sigma factor (sigma-70 family)